MRQIKLNRQKLGVEDLLFGTGTEEQTRGNQQAIVTKINAGNLPFDETRSLSEFAQQVNLEQLGNSITELLNINTNLSTFFTVEDNLGILTIIEESITNLNSLYTNLQAILDVNANESNINSVQSNESNINTLSSSITNLNSLYTNLQAILDVNANKSNINAVNTNESNINAVNTNESNINTIVTNLNALLTIFDNLSGLLNIDPYQFNKIGFKTNINETVSIGQVAWNQQESTIDVGLNSEVTLQVGQEELVLVKNVTGTTINNGKVVMVVGSNGNSGNLLVALHDGTKASAVPTLGITTQDIANDTSGFVTKSGKVRGINTSGSTVGETWVDGDVLYVSTNGNLTKVVPGDTALKMAIAVVINAHGSNGTLFVRTNGLDENHDKELINNRYTKTEVDSKIKKRRNYLINGNFGFWDYATSQTTAGYGSDNRWVNGNQGTTKTHSRMTSGDTERAFFESPYYSRTVVSSVPGASNYVIKTQAIEDLTKLAGKMVTLSFWAKADSTKNIAVEFKQNFGTGGTPSVELTGISPTTFSLTTIWKKYTVTVTTPSLLGKTLGTDGIHTSWMQVQFWFDAGSDYDSRTNNLGQQSGTFDIAEVKLEDGSIATDGWAPYDGEWGSEAVARMRYYEQVNNLTFHSPYSAPSTSGEMLCTWVYKVQKRTYPTLVSSVGLVNIAPAVTSAKVQLATNPLANIVTYLNLTASAEL